MDEHFGGGGYGAPVTGYDVIEKMKRDDAVEFLGGKATEMVRDHLDEFLRPHPRLASQVVRIRLTKPYSANEVVDAGGKIGRNVREFRNTLGEFIKDQSSSYL